MRLDAGEQPDRVLRVVAPGGDERHDVDRQADPPRVLVRDLELEALGHRRARLFHPAPRQLDAGDHAESVGERGGQPVAPADGGDGAHEVVGEVVLAAQVRRPAAPEPGEDHGDVVLRPVARVLDRLVERRRRAVLVAAEEARRAVLRQRGARAVHVAGAAEQGERPLEVAAGARVVALRERGQRARDERAAEEERLGRRVEGERAVHELPRLAKLSREVPVPVHRADEPEPELGPLRGRHRPRRRRAQVVLLGDDPRQQPGPALAPQEVGRRRLGEGEEEPGVAALDSLELPRLDEAFERVLAHGLEQPVARHAVARLHDDERLVHQRRDAVEDVLGLERRAGADGFGGLQREAAVERGQAAQQHLLARAEQRVAPLHRRSQRAVARQRRAAPRGEQAEGVVEAVRDLLGRQHAHARRGELDRERDAVEPPADLGHGRRVARRQRERRRRGLRPLDEQLHRLGARHRRHEPRRLAAHAERLAARRQHREPRAGAQQLLGELRALLHQVLAVVEDEQHPVAADLGHEQLERRRAGALGEVQHGRDVRGERVAVGERREVHPGDAGEVGGRAQRRLAGESRLAAAAGAGEGQQPRRAHEARQVVELAVATDEARQVNRQLADGDGAGCERPTRSAR